MYKTEEDALTAQKTAIAALPEDAPTNKLGIKQFVDPEFHTGASCAPRLNLHRRPHCTTIRSIYILK